MTTTADRGGVLMLSMRYYPVFGGAATQARRLSAELRRRGWQVSVVTGRFGNAPRREQIDDVAVLRTRTWGARRSTSLHLAFSLTSLLPLLLRSRRHAILHIHGVGPFTVLPVLVARLFGLKVVLKMTLVGADDASTVTARFGELRRQAFRRADAVITLSAPMSDSYRASGFDAKKLVEMPQGVDIERFSPASDETRRELRQRLALPADETILIFVGALALRKGADLAAEAFRRLAPKWPRLRLLMVGMDESTYSPVRAPDELAFCVELKRGLRGGGFEERVTFTGLVDNVDEYLRASDLFLFPSRREGFPTAMVEAMAAGLPCVVSALDGASAQLFESGRDGVIVEGEEAGAFADALEALLEAPETARRMAGEARRKAEAKHSLSGVADRYVALYERLLERNASRSS